MKRGGGRTWWRGRGRIQRGGGCPRKAVWSLDYFIHDDFDRPSVSVVRIENHCQRITSIQLQSSFVCHGVEADSVAIFSRGILELFLHIVDECFSALRKCVGDFFREGNRTAEDNSSMENGTGIDQCPFTLMIGESILKISHEGFIPFGCHLIERLLDVGDEASVGCG